MLSRETMTAVDCIKGEAAAWEQQHGRGCEGGDSACGATRGSAERLNVNASVADAGNNGVPFDEAKAFFTKRVRSKQEAAGVSGVDFEEDHTGISHNKGDTFVISEWQRAEADDRLRRVHAVAVLATSALDAAGPLISSQALRVRGPDLSQGLLCVWIPPESGFRVQSQTNAV